MHLFTLHRPVQVECVCCRITTEFLFKSHSDHVICRGCLRHQGESLPKLKQRNTDHLGLWTSTIAIQAEEAKDRENGLSRRIASLEEELGRERMQVDDLRETVKRGFDDAPLPAVKSGFMMQKYRKPTVDAMRRIDGVIERSRCSG